MRGLFIAFALFVAAPASAQVHSRPTDPPIVTAENESWYRLAEPLQFAGDLYYPAGARVFFNGNTMVRTGHYNGVPFYADTTIEPYSIVYVPIPRGLMQPYERLRRGDLAGTTGSRAPSFPVGTSVGGRGVLIGGIAAHRIFQDRSGRLVRLLQTQDSRRRRDRPRRPGAVRTDRHAPSSREQRRDLDSVRRVQVDQRRESPFR